MSRLVECKDCGHMVSRSAYDCPNCGKRIKRRLWEVGPFTTAVVLIPLILVILAMCAEV